MQFGPDRKNFLIVILFYLFLLLLFCDKAAGIGRLLLAQYSIACSLLSQTLHLWVFLKAASEVTQPHLPE